MVRGLQRLYSVRHEIEDPNTTPLQRLQRYPFGVLCLAYAPVARHEWQEHADCPDCEWEVVCHRYLGTRSRRYVRSRDDAERLVVGWKAEDHQVQELLIERGEEELQKTDAQYVEEYSCYNEFWGPGWYRRRVEGWLEGALTWCYFGVADIQYVGPYQVREQPGPDPDGPSAVPVADFDWPDMGGILGVPEPDGLGDTTTIGMGVGG